MSKLNAKQTAVLLAAAGTFEINFMHALKAGANGRTLSALVVRALLVKHEYPDGSNAWRITDAGRAAVGVAA